MMSHPIADNRERLMVDLSSVLELLSAPEVLELDSLLSAWRKKYLRRPDEIP